METATSVKTISLDTRTPAEIKNSLQATGDLIREIDRTANLLQEDIAPDKVGALNTALEMVRDGQATLVGAREKFPAKDKDADELFDLYRRKLEAEKRKQEFEREYVPFKAQEVEEQIKDLAGRIDYDRVVGFVDNLEVHKGSLSRVFHQLYQLRRLEYSLALGILETYELEALEKTEVTLNEFKNQWQQKGFLQDSVRSYSFQLNDNSEIEESHMELEAKVGRAIMTLKHAETLNRIFRPKRVSSITDFPLEEISRALDLRSVGIIDWARIGLNPRLITATDSYVQERLNSLALKGKYPQTTQQKRKYLETVCSAGKLDLKVGGIKEGDMNYSIFPSSILKELYSKFPNYFVADIHQLVISEDRESAFGGFFPGFSHENEYIGGRMEIYIDPKVMPTSSETTRTTMANYIMGVIYHELGHATLYKLTYDDLVDWSDLIKDEQIFATWYVEKAAKEGQSNDEDFCESLMIFAINPAALKVIGPKRFKYFRELFQSYIGFGSQNDFSLFLDQRIKVQEELWELAAVTIEDIKREYFNIYRDMDYE